MNSFSRLSMTSGELLDFLELYFLVSHTLILHFYFAQFGWKVPDAFTAARKCGSSEEIRTEIFTSVYLLNILFHSFNSHVEHPKQLWQRTHVKAPSVLYCVCVCWGPWGNGLVCPGSNSSPKTPPLKKRKERKKRVEWGAAGPPTFMWDQPHDDEDEEDEGSLVVET